jgi:hypothetical protein
MLNRTNRTLSANLNRLNLGTRSLALQAGVNTVAQAHALRHDHLRMRKDSMRVGMDMPVDISIPRYPSTSSIPSSPPAFGWALWAESKRLEPLVVADVPPVRTEVVPTGRPTSTGGLRGQCAQPATSRASSLPAALVATGG